jgi:hypothetical protein
MKLLTALRMCAPVVGLDAILVFAPQSRAQSEVAPDHFDGTDSWQIALNAKAPAAKRAVVAAHSSAAPVRNQRSSAKAQAKSAQNTGRTQQGELVAVDDKRKLAARKSDPR